MIAKPTKIVVYQDDHGKEPFTEWVKSCDKTIRAKVFTRLDRVEAGNWGDYKSLGENLYELRIQAGPGIRVYFGRVEAALILLLAGGTKVSQSRDIRKARKSWDIFKRSNKL